MHPVGYLLIAIGSSLVLSAVIFCLVSLRKRTATEIVLENDKVELEPNNIGGERRLNHIIVLKERSKVNIKITPISSHLDIGITYLVAHSISSTEERFRITPVLRKHIETEPLETSIELDKGSYTLFFSRFGVHYQPVQVICDLVITYDIQPWKKLLGVGLQLLEIGLPVLITGIVLFFGLQT